MMSLHDPTSLSFVSHQVGQFGALVLEHEMQCDRDQVADEHDGSRTSDRKNLLTSLHPRNYSTNDLLQQCTLA